MSTLKRVNIRKTTSAPYTLRPRPPLADLQVNDKETNVCLPKKDERITRISSATASFRPTSLFSGENDGSGDLSIFEKRPVSPIKEIRSVRSKNIKMPSLGQREDAHEVNFDLFDPLSDEYYEDITAHSLSLENKFVIKTDDTHIKYEKQWQKRNNALSWAYCVQEYLQVSNDTFMKAVYLFDNIIRSYPVPEDMVQLLILTLIWIEQKNTTQAFGAKKILALKKSFSPHTLLYLEKKILQIFDFNTIVEEPLQFVRYFLKKLNFTGELLQHAMFTCFYLIESYVFNENFSKIPPSKLAAAAVLYQVDVKKPSLDWDRQAKSFIICYSKIQLTPIFKELLRNVRKISQDGRFVEVYNRYKTKEKLMVSRQFGCVRF